MKSLQFTLSDTEESIWGTFFGICAKNYNVTSILYGFSHSFFTSKRIGLTRSLLLRHNHPQDYVNFIGKNEFLNNDFCALAIINGDAPYFWHTAKDDPNLSARQRAQNEIDQRFKMDVGVSFSLRFANGRGIGGLGMCMGTSTADEFEHIWQRYGAEMAELVQEFDRHMRPAMVRKRLKLSPREREVLAYSAGGMLAKEIAEYLGLKTKTVYNTLERARTSMEAASTMEAVAKAYIYELI
jgi:LuxR family transcriptional regulator, quorum-sensing system regulator SdiA